MNPKAGGCDSKNLRRRRTTSDRERNYRSDRERLVPQWQQYRGGSPGVELNVKTIIAGGRRYQFSPADMIRLNELHCKLILPVSEVVSGCCGEIDSATGEIFGADLWGEEWANSHGIPIKRFPADWKKLGKAAGMIRNRQMAEYAEACILFPGGPGTNNMFGEATKRGLKIFDWRQPEAK